MELRADGLSLTIEFAPPDDEGWMRCGAVVDVPGFHGDVDFSMLRSDLESFQADLAASLDASNWPCTARLASTDPGIDLSFRVERTGRIAGRYVFRGGEGCGPVLSGSFLMDQTYLGPLLDQTRRQMLDPV